MIPTPLDTHNAMLDREIENDVDTLMHRYDNLEKFYPYSPFCVQLDVAVFYNASGHWVHGPALHLLGNNTLRKWIDLAYVAVTETVGIHTAIRSSANKLIDDFSHELVQREMTEWDGELPL